MAPVREISPKQIKQSRLAKGYSVDDLAHEVRRHGFKTNGANVSKWERGVASPRAGVLPALAAALDISIDELYEERDPDDDESDDALSRAAKGLVSALTAEIRRAAEGVNA